MRALIDYLTRVFRGLRNATHRKHVKQETWNWSHFVAYYTHDCDHWFAFACRCKGSCNCHWCDHV